MSRPTLPGDFIETPAPASATNLNSGELRRSSFLPAIEGPGVAHQRCRTSILSLVRRLVLSILIASAVISLPAQTRITSPKEYLGFNVGDDYQLANYTQLAQYWRKLDAESDRLTVQEIGKTAEGRPQLMAIVTSPANHRALAKYRDISRRLALAEGLSVDEAHRLAREGKAVVDRRRPSRDGDSRRAR